MSEVPAKDISVKDIGGPTTMGAPHDVVVARQAVGVNDQGRLHRGGQSFFEYCEHAAEAWFLTDCKYRAFLPAADTNVPLVFEPTWESGVVGWCPGQDR
jgi:hypothetical protein